MPSREIAHCINNGTAYTMYRFDGEYRRRFFFPSPSGQSVFHVHFKPLQNWRTTSFVDSKVKKTQINTHTFTHRRIHRFKYILSFEKGQSKNRYWYETKKNWFRHKCLFVTLIRTGFFVCPKRFFFSYLCLYKAWKWSCVLNTIKEEEEEDKTHNWFNKMIRLYMIKKKIEIYYEIRLTLRSGEE